MGRTRLPIIHDRKTDKLPPLVVQTVRYLGARAEDAGFFTTEDAEKAIAENRVQIRRLWDTYSVSYKSTRGLSISKTFKFPLEEEHDGKT